MIKKKKIQKNNIWIQKYSSFFPYQQQQQRQQKKDLP